MLPDAEPEDDALAASALAPDAAEPDGVAADALAEAPIKLPCDEGALHPIANIATATATIAANITFNLFILALLLKPCEEAHLPALAQGGIPPLRHLFRA